MQDGLIAQVLDLFGLAHFHFAILRLPGIDGVLAHTLLPSHIFGRAARLNLLQRSDDLRLRVLASAHYLHPSFVQIVFRNGRRQARV